MVNLNRILFFYVTYIFVLCNFAVAYIPALNLVALGVRDAWMIIFIIILLISEEFLLLLFLFFAAVFGLVGALNYDTEFNFFVYAYGLRDMFLLAFFLFYISNRNQYVTEREARFFVLLVSLSALIEILSYPLGYSSIFSNLYRSDIYFAAKGIQSHLQGGFFGNRVTAPLYSASLLATCLVFFFATRLNGYRRFLYLPIAMMTLSKVVPLAAGVYLFRKRPLVFIAIFVLVLLLAKQVLEAVIISTEPSMITYHLGSVMDRYASFSLTSSGLSNPFNPQYLGFSSIAGHLLNGLDPTEAPESLLLAKLFDYKILGIIVFAPFVLRMRQCHRSKYFLLILFLLLQLFSSLSNHPVAFAASIMSMSALITTRPRQSAR